MTQVRGTSSSFVALSCVGFVASFATPAAAQDQKQPDVDGVTVTGTALDDGYKVDRLSSPKATAPLLDTPRIVNVVTAEILEDTASFSLQDALRTVPGITLGAGEGGTASADIPMIRGVDATGDTFVDGARDAGSQTRETFAVERVEIFKGPNSAFGGRGAAAGAINIVSKLPVAGNFVAAQLTGGTADFKRATADVNAELVDGLAVRVVGMWHDADVAGRDDVFEKRWGVAPSIAWGVGTPTTATLSYYHYETDGIPDYGIPLTARGQLPGGVREPVDVDYDNFYGLLSRDFQETVVNSMTFQFRHALNDQWSLANTTRYSHTRNAYIATNPDDSRGNVVNGLVSRNTKNRHSMNEALVSNFNVSGVFGTGGIEHSLAFGAEISQSDTDSYAYTIAPAATPAICNAAQLANYNCTSLQNPNAHDPWTGTITLSTTPATSSVEDLSFYAFDTVTIIPQLLLNGGVRWTTYRANGANGVGAARAVFRNKSEFWTWQGGVIFKPTDATSIYFSYADSKSPPGSDVGEGLNNLSATNDLYEPQTTENLEVGAKADLFGGNLQLSAAAFQVDRGNITNTDPGAATEIVASRARLRGFEVGLTGRAGPLSLFGGYTLVDSEILEEATPAAGAASTLGNALPNTPRHNVALTASLEITPQFSIGGGAYAASERFADNANLVRADGYTRFDANASFKFNENVTLRANVQNVGDERYVVKLRNPHFAVPAIGRQALLTLSARY